MKHLKLIFACLLMSVLSIGQVWATEETATTTFANKTSGTWAQNQSPLPCEDGGNSWDASATVAGWDTNRNLQFSCTASTGATISLTSSDFQNTTIKEVSVVVSRNKSYDVTLAVTVNGSTLGDGDSGANNAQNATLTTSSTTGIACGTGDVVITLSTEAPASKPGSLYVQSISVTYETSSGGGSSNPTVSADPTSWDFGAVATDASASKVFSVSGSNLTAGTLTLTAPSGYSVSPTSISVASAGGLDATNVTVSKNTSTAGTYNGNLTISGCGLESAVNVALSMEVKAKYTVTWNNNGVTSTSQVLDGAKPVFPATPASCATDCDKFYGWATEAWTGKLTDISGKTIHTSNATMDAVTAEGTVYYAVFTDVVATDYSTTYTSNVTLPSSGTNVSSATLVIGENDNIDAFKLGKSGAGATGSFTVNSGTTKIYLHAAAWNGKTVSLTLATNVGSISPDDAQNLTSNSGIANSSPFTLNTTGTGFDFDDLFFEYTLENVDDEAEITVTATDERAVIWGVNAVASASSGDAHYMTTCCTKYNVNIAEGITNGTVSADLAQACEGATITLTFTPALNYHLSGWTLNGTEQDVNDNTFTMPAEAVTVSATFAQDACDPLGTPSVTVSGKAYPYDAVKLTWTAISNADAYKVYIYDNEDNELEHNDAFTGVEYTIGQTLGGSTTYKYSVQAVSNTPATYCPSTEAESTFTTDALPTAHLTLIDPDGTHASSGDYAILTPFNLPTTAAACSKAFVGWDADPDCATAPTYVKGAEFTFANTTGVTLHAVYADGGATNETITKTMSEIVSENSYTVSSGNNATMYKVLALNSDITLSTTGDDNCGSFWGTSPNHEWRLYQNKSGNAIVTAASGCTLTNVKFTFSESNTGALLNGSDVMTSGTAVSASGSPATYTVGNSGNATNGQIRITAVEVKYTKAGSYSNYSTTCAAAPEVIVDPEEVNVSAAAVAAGVIEAAYDNVDEENLSVALFNDQACTEAFDGSWLTASLNGDKKIAYTIAENTSYNDARTAYIKLTAPASSTGVADAVVVIPVSQAKKAAVFASLQELVAADVNANTNVTVSFSNVVIKEIYMYNSNRRGLVFDIQKAGEDIKIYFNADVPAAWAAGGKVSGTLTNCPWKIYSDAWQLAPASGWAWDNGDLTYTAPPAIASIEIRGAATEKTYIDGQAFNPAGLSVIAIYDNSDEEDVTTYATWTYDPAKLSESDTQVEVTAEYNDKSDSETITGLTVNPIPSKTIAEFIAAGGTRCYLEGIVSNYTNTTKGYFDMTDASGTIHIYGCTSPSSFAAGDKVKVIAEVYEYYQSTTHEAKNVEFVSKKSPATMTFSDMALEFGDVETMAPATITLADASDIVYSIKDGSDDCVTISGDQITAKSVAGTATIVATLAETADYVGTTVEFVVTVTAPIVKYAITFDGNGADGGSAPAAIADKAAGEEVTLPANSYTKTSKVFDGWKVINNTTTEEVTVTAGAFLMPASAVTIQAQWTDAPYWSTVYDNNVSVIQTGSGATGTITIGTDDPYTLVKAGASSNTGTIVVTVPYGTTDLHFHAFAWGGKTAKIQISGVTNPSVSEFDLEGEAGASGSGNDFTLQGNPVDQYFHVSFDAVEEVTQITFSKATGSADNRFFFYGVNQEGGQLPVLQSIAIGGDLNNKSYKAGQALDMTGLTVEATYTLGGTPQTPVDITNEQGLTWTYDPLVENQEEVTVTAHFGEETANKTITGLTVASADPMIYVSSLNVNFGSVEVGAAVPDNETVTVTLTNVAAATATLDGEGFEITPTALTASGDITISVTASTTAAASYSATITITDDAGEAAQKVVNLSFAVTEPVVTEEYQLVSDVASLAAGDQIIIVAENEGDYYTLDGSISSQYFPSTAVSISAGIITAPSTSAIILGKDVDNWTMSMGGQLIGATAAKKASLGNTTTATNTWTIAIAENVATITNTVEGYGSLQFNYNNGTNPRFLNYASAQTAVAIYKKVAPEPVLDWTLIREEELEAGRYYTVCLNKAITHVDGASFWSITYGNESVAYLEEEIPSETEPLAAGKPFIFYTTSTEPKVVLEGDAVDDPVENGALRGTLTGLDADAINLIAENIYMLKNNALHPVLANNGNYLAANRAYVLKSALQPGTPQSAPGKRVKSMPLQKDVATDIDAINVSENPMKLMIDGQIYILRGEKLYDVTGKLVK